MSAITRLFNHLKNLWSILAVVAVLFPGAAALLKVPIAVQESKIAPLYPVIASIVAAFAVLFLTTYRERLRELRVAHRLSLVGIACAILCFFSFVFVRTYFLDVDLYHYVGLDSQMNVEVWEYKKRGIIKTEHVQRIESVDEPTTPPDAVPIYQYERGDPMDIVALMLFTGTFASLGFAFSALGIHTYEASRAEKPAQAAPDNAAP